MVHSRRQHIDSFHISSLSLNPEAQQPATGYSWFWLKLCQLFVILTFCPQNHRKNVPIDLSGALERALLMYAHKHTRTHTIIQSMWSLNWSKMVNFQSSSHLKINLMSSQASMPIQRKQTTERHEKRIGKSNKSTLSVSNRGNQWIILLPNKTLFCAFN